MPANFTLSITSPEGDTLWTGSFADFAEANEGRPTLLAAVQSLQPGKDLIAGICCFGDSEDGVAPQCSRVRRHEERASISSALMMLCMAIGLVSAQGCDQPTVDRGESSSESSGGDVVEASSSSGSSEGESSEGSSESSESSGSSGTDGSSSEGSSSDGASSESSTGEPPCPGTRPRFDACGDVCGALCQDALVCRPAGEDLAECTHECVGDDECGAGTCSGGFCILFPCGSNADCPGGTECYAGDEHPDAHCVPHGV